MSFITLLERKFKDKQQIYSDDNGKTYIFNDYLKYVTNNMILPFTILPQTIKTNYFFSDYHNQFLQQQIYFCFDNVAFNQKYKGIVYVIAVNSCENDKTNCKIVDSENHIISITFWQDKQVIQNIFPNNFFSGMLLFDQSNHLTGRQYQQTQLTYYIDETTLASRYCLLNNTKLHQLLGCFDGEKFINGDSVSLFNHKNNQLNNYYGISQIKQPVVDNYIYKNRLDEVHFVSFKFYQEIQSFLELKDQQEKQSIIQLQQEQLKAKNVPDVQKVKKKNSREDDLKLITSTPPKFIKILLHTKRKNILNNNPKQDENVIISSQSQSQPTIIQYQIQIQLPTVYINIKKNILHCHLPRFSEQHYIYSVNKQLHIISSGVLLKFIKQKLTVQDCQFTLNFQQQYKNNELNNCLTKMEFSGTTPVTIFIQNVQNIPVIIKLD